MSYSNIELQRFLEAQNKYGINKFNSMALKYVESVISYDYELPMSHFKCLKCNNSLEKSIDLSNNKEMHECHELI